MFKFIGFGIDISARTIEEKSCRLIEGLAAAGLAKRLEDEIEAGRFAIKK
ncbi:hypothetical protein [Sporomusa carbonis]